MNKWFNNFATKAANITGRSYTFVAAILILVIWAIGGPIMQFSDTWQLMINTFTTLVTFLMVFIIQNSTNRAANAQQIKLDFILEILGVDDEDVRELENMDDKQLEEVLEAVQKNRDRAKDHATRKSGKARKSRAK